VRTESADNPGPNAFVTGARGRVLGPGLHNEKRIEVMFAQRGVGEPMLGEIS
jgi:hypothetical protein